MKEEKKKPGVLGPGLARLTAWPATEGRFVNTL